jgi:hypothetical protein
MTRFVHDETPTNHIQGLSMNKNLIALALSTAFLAACDKAPTPAAKPASAAPAPQAVEPAASAAPAASPEVKKDDASNPYSTVTATEAKKDDASNPYGTATATEAKKEEPAKNDAAPSADAKKDDPKK